MKLNYNFQEGGVGVSKEKNLPNWMPYISFFTILNYSSENWVESFATQVYLKLGQNGKYTRQDIYQGGFLLNF